MLTKVLNAAATALVLILVGAAVRIVAQGPEGHPAPLQQQPPPTPVTQQPAATRPGPAGGAPAAPGGGLGGSPRREQDKAAVDRGKGLFGVSCGFCHGSDARGGSTGPNLWRSALILTDQSGAEIAKVIRAGRPDKGMPPMPLQDAQIADIVAYLHSLPVGGRDQVQQRPASIVVGNAASGERYFQKTCAICHSATGDMKGLATKYADPRQLQHAWLMPGSQRGGAPTASRRPEVVVTLASGQVVTGTLARIDDFVVSLVDATGETRTYARTGTGPTVELRDRLEPHRRLVPTYADSDIHNLTAYLVTLK
jgi:cytochrome c oxidase cbb3-type subunit III